jgi:hypothetical protein
MGGVVLAVQQVSNLRRRCVNSDWLRAYNCQRMTRDAVSCERFVLHNGLGVGYGD